MPRGGRRRGRGRRGGGGERAAGPRAEQAPQKDLDPGRSRSARRRRARRSQRGEPPTGRGSAVESMVTKPKTLQTLPPDGLILEDVISDLQSEYGTPATPQEFRLLIRLPEGSEPAIIAPAGEPPAGSDEDISLGAVEIDVEDSVESEEPADAADEELAVRRPRRRRRRRRGRGSVPRGPRPPMGGGEAPPSSGPNGSGS